MLLYILPEHLMNGDSYIGARLDDAENAPLLLRVSACREVRVDNVGAASASVFECWLHCTPTCYLQRR